MLATKGDSHGLTIAGETRVPRQCLAGDGFTAIERIVTAESRIKRRRNAMDSNIQICRLTDGIALTIDQADGYGRRAISQRLQPGRRKTQVPAPLRCCCGLICHAADCHRDLRARRDIGCGTGDHQRALRFTGIELTIT
ncbi:hypothetical protein SRABI106_04848 [Rahnella aquatilis]|nr:hypothetical protein SRABI106_04848 [Rahnella aquatilis]